MNGEFEGGKRGLNHPALRLEVIIDLRDRFLVKLFLLISTEIEIPRQIAIKRHSNHGMAELVFAVLRLFVAALGNVDGRGGIQRLVPGGIGLGHRRQEDVSPLPVADIGNDDIGAIHRENANCGESLPYRVFILDRLH